MGKVPAEFYLLGIVIVWGSTFAVIKDVLPQIMPFTFLAFRFFIATLVLGLIFWKRLKLIDKNILGKGVLIGIFLFMGYTFQTLGLKYTTATKAGFITGLSVVLVPLFSFFFFKEKIQRNSTMGVILAFFGLWLLNYNNSLSFNLGDFLVLICAISFAFHIISVGLYTKRLDYILLVILQLFTVFSLSTIFSLFLEGSALFNYYSYKVWWAIILTAVFATSLAFYMQNRFQQYSTATKTAIIFSGEPIFAAIFAYLLLGEKISLIAWVGGLLIFGGMIIAQKDHQ
ncbi:MAG: DMT family transporter [Candidatus Caldatribacteriota bacterium]